MFKVSAFGIFTIFFITEISFSQGPVGGKKDTPIQVNIDNPQFRKLLVAVPPFVVAESLENDAEAKVAELAREELIRLLGFTGLFKITHGDVYKQLMPKINKALNKNTDIDQQEGKKSLDLPSWKSLGMESLTVGVAKKQKERLSFEMRTADVKRGKIIIGKRYWVTSGNYKEAMRTYADWILKSYTGKEGMFQSRLVFVGRKNKEDSKQVYISDFDGGNLQQITDKENPHVTPGWSPNGRYITYTSFEDGNPDLFIYDVLTKQKRKLSGQRGLNSGADWAPGGNLIAFTGSKKGDADIYTILKDGTRRRLLITGHGLDVDPAFSPDKKWMAFVSGRFGNPHVFVGTLKWTDQDQVKVVADRRITYAGWYNATPSWSPDSEKLAFAGYDKDINRFDIFIVNPDGANLERLTLKSGDNESPSWSPNGQLLTFQSNRIGNQNAKGPAKIYLMNRDGSGQREVSMPLYDAQTPSWGPNINLQSNPLDAP